MQLFGLVNTMLAHDRATAERDLSIARYAVIPLSPNSGASSGCVTMRGNAAHQLLPRKSQGLPSACRKTAWRWSATGTNRWTYADCDIEGQWALPAACTNQQCTTQRAPHDGAGLIGWVPNTDTLHALIREYRDARKIPLNVEHRLMLGMAPDYDHLTVIQKVEVFEHALDSTSGGLPCTLSV